MLLLLLLFMINQAESTTNTTTTKTTSNTTDSTNTTTNTTTTKKKTQATAASYPNDLLTYDQIKKGGFIIYIIGTFLYKFTSLGIMYCFVGISLATQNYINPSIDIIKKKNVVIFILCYFCSSHQTQ